MINVGEFVLKLKESEGYRKSVYKDSVGYYTIGIGTLVDAGLGEGITLEEAIYLAGNRVKLFMGELDRQLPWWQGLPPGVQEGLLEMAYNLGIPKLLQFKKMLTALEMGDWRSAHDNALDSLWAKQVGQRAQRIANVFLKGE